MVAVSNPPRRIRQRKNWWGWKALRFVSSAAVNEEWEVSFAPVSLIRQGGSDIKGRLETRGQVRTRCRNTCCDLTCELGRHGHSKHDACSLSHTFCEFFSGVLRGKLRLGFRYDGRRGDAEAPTVGRRKLR